MKTIKKGDDGFYLAVDHLREHLSFSSYDGKFSTQNIVVGDTRIELTSTRSCLEGSSLSSRHLLLVGETAGRRSFVASGYHLKSRGKFVSQEALYDAADQMGEEEADEIASLIDAHMVPRLFAQRSALVLPVWEASAPEIAILAIGAACDSLKRPVVAINCAPRHFSGPPRPEAAVREHVTYRKALVQSVPQAKAVADGLHERAADVVLFAKQVERDFNEQLVALVTRTGILNGPP
jgi:hypothetical protein